MRRSRSVFLTGWDLISDDRRLMVRFAVPPDERTWLLQRLQTLSEELLIAAQLGLDVAETNKPARPNLGSPT